MSNSRSGVVIQPTDDTVSPQPNEMNRKILMRKRVPKSCVCRDGVSVQFFLGGYLLGIHAPGIRDMALVASAKQPVSVQQSCQRPSRIGTARKPEDVHPVAVCIMLHQVAVCV